MTAHALGPEGALSRVFDQFEPRPGQQQLADAIAEAIAGQYPLIAEAGTGIGKTFAYLVPVLESGVKAVISTGTRTLQDQLFKRDLPRLVEALGVVSRVALLKGRSNYLCLHRLNALQGELDEPELLESLEAVKSWASYTRTGELAELPDLPDRSPLRPMVTSTVDNCLGGECPVYGDCHLMKARRRAADADVVVVNHHLLFADLALKQQGFGELLPSADVIVVDEAHQVPDVASRFFGRDLTSRQLTELARDTRVEAAAEPGAGAAVAAALSGLDTAVKRLRLALSRLPPRGVWEQIERDADSREELAALAEALTRLKIPLAELAPASAGLDSVHARCQHLGTVLALLCDSEQADYVRWYEHTRTGFQLHATPLNLDEALAGIRETAAPCWIYTSATLSVAGRFDLYVDQLGLETAETLTVDSPFDYRKNALLYHPDGLPEPSHRDYVVAWIDALRPVLELTGGRAFLLFTAHRNLQRAAELLTDQLDYPLFVQGRAPRHQLLKDFRAAGNGILLGAASFWQGVDVPGQALSCVAVDKLPFAPPDDPVVEARLKKMKSEGRQPFGEYQLPSAVLTLKQGLGRLLRHENDRGLLVIGDPRLATRGYGKTFLNSLPPVPYTRQLADIEDFFSH